MICSRCCMKCSSCEKVYKPLGYTFKKEVADNTVSKLRKEKKEALAIEVQEGRFLICTCNDFKCSLTGKQMSVNESLSNWCHNYKEVCFISN